MDAFTLSGETAETVTYQLVDDAGDVVSLSMPRAAFVGEPAPRVVWVQVSFKPPAEVVDFDYVGRSERTLRLV